MKKTKLLFGLGILAAVGIVLVAADHIDAPGAAGTTADIADFYGFESPSNADNTVFVVDLQTNVDPTLAYGSFDEDVLTEVNIDTDGDLMEDLVIQAIARRDTMFFFGPVVPTLKGLTSQVMVDNPLGKVVISGANAITATTSDGVSLFAGPRQDSFFFDFGQFNKVIGGMAPEGFLEEGTDTFDGANTMALVIEIPNSMLGETTATNVLGLEVYKTWVTTNKKQ